MEAEEVRKYTRAAAIAHMPPPPPPPLAALEIEPHQRASDVNGKGGGPGGAIGSCTMALSLAGFDEASGGSDGATGFGDERDESYVMIDVKGHRHECGDYVPPDSELRRFIVGVKKEHAQEGADAVDDGWGTAFLSQRLKDYEAHFGRYPTARPTSKELEGKAEYEGMLPGIKPIAMPAEPIAMPPTESTDRAAAGTDLSGRTRRCPTP
eukprot:3302503-Prymnesium_polylepis.1